jgi:hypothetical protein
MKPSLFEFAKLALRGGAPKDIAEYAWTEFRGRVWSPEADTFTDESGAVSPTMVTHTTPNGVMTVGWDKFSRRAVWSWEPRLD